MATYWFRIHFGGSGKWRNVCCKADYPQQAIRWIQDLCKCFAPDMTIEPLFTLLFVASVRGQYKAT